MFEEYMEDKQICQVYKCNGVMGRNKDYLLGKPVNNDQNSVKSEEQWKFLIKIYRNRIPWLFGNRKLFERFIVLVILWFRLYTSNTRLAELLYISIETVPEISIANKSQYFVLTKMFSKNMIMIILENMCIEITSRWYIDFVIKTEKTISICRLLAICRDVFCSNWVTRKSQKDVSVQSVQINYCSYIKRREKKNSSLYRGHKLFLSKDWFEVVRVNCGIASIPSLWQTFYYLVRVFSLVLRQPEWNLITRLN